MWRIGLVVLCTLGLFVAPLTSEGQQSAKVQRLGILTVSSSGAFEQELHKLGYIEGRNIVTSGGIPRAASSRWPVGHSDRRVPT
jgi:hypothetical protein